MPTKRGITLFFVPHDRKRSLSLRLSGWQVILGGIILGIALLLLVVGVFLGGKSTKIVAENRRLRAENERLRSQLAKIATLERELYRTSELRLWMEDIVGVSGSGEPGQIRTASLSGGDLFALLETPFKPKLVPEFADAAKEKKRRLDFIPRGLPVKGAITARFGEMGGKFMSPHTGVDIAAPEGTIVKATAAGIVSEIKIDSQLGVVLSIDHLNGYETQYGHLSSVSCKIGTWVEPNDKIGIVGETGHATGPHVHYEIRSEGELIDPLIGTITNNKES